jgi:2-polyprenyl-6-methoxyphenol hydroxylase-like FAD-dependent oxidoreductase
VSTINANTAAVVIVGAGPTGLLLACELGVRGISVILIEESLGPSRHPKSNTQSARTMEIYRRHGLAARLRELGLPRDRNTDVAYFSRLFGHELHRVPLPSLQDAERAVRAGDLRWPTPEPQTRVTQMVVEPLLLERARSFPTVDVRFGWKATDLEQDGDSVSLSIKQTDTGARQVLTASFLVGCDGGKSFIRKALGIRFLGEGGLEMDFLGGRMLATYFRSQALLERFPHADTWMHWIMQPAGRAILVLIDRDRHEFLLHFQLKNAGENEHTVDFAARLAAVVGEEIPHEVVSSAVWRAGIGLVAEHFSRGRCHLVGDAIHLFSPTGGFGLNTGIEDAFNLGWKLAAVCRGVAPGALLDTYELERRPIALRNTQYALQLTQRNGACPVSAALDDDGPAGEAARATTRAHLQEFARWEFDTPGVQLGARYDGSPLVDAQGAPVPADSPTTYQPSTVPGGRLPHVFLDDGESSFDRLGPEFTLLLLASSKEGDAWRTAAIATGIPLTVVDLAGQPAALAVLGTDSLLVRPDQHIAWRGRAAVLPEALLRAAVGHGLTEVDDRNPEEAHAE